MFKGFAEVWSPVVPASWLKRDKPLATTLAGEKLALFRDGHGGVGAMLDRCPHRGVALSLGRVTPEGCLECPFHGWTFASDGACVRVPLNDLAADKRARLAATALPAREAGGLIWVYTGADARGTEPAVPEALTEPGWSRWTIMQRWDTHWTRAMENMLDSPHVPYLHRRTIGRGLRARMRPDAVMHLETEPTDTGFLIHWRVGDQEFRAGLEFRRPNGMVLYIARGKHGFRQHVFCVPEDEGHVRMLLVSTRQFLRHNPLGWLSDQFNRMVLREDRAVVESSQPPEVPPPADERSVATDGPTLAFRKYYYRELRGGPLTLLRPSRAG